MDATRFEKLVNQHKDSVYRQMARVCSHREDAEDALATALMLAFQSADRLSSEEAFRSWLSTIGRRVCTRMRSSPSMQPVLELAEDLKVINNDPEPFEMEVLKGCVQEAVNDLPEIYREVYQACEIEERTVPEVAEGLGLSVAATKSRLLRARAMVRERLDHSICAI